MTTVKSFMRFMWQLWKPHGVYTTIVKSFMSFLWQLQKASWGLCDNYEKLQEVSVTFAKSLMRSMWQSWSFMRSVWQLWKASWGLCDNCEKLHEVCVTITKSLVVYVTIVIYGTTLYIHTRETDLFVLCASHTLYTKRMLCIWGTRVICAKCMFCVYLLCAKCIQDACTYLHRAYKSFLVCAIIEHLHLQQSVLSSGSDG